MATTPNRTYRPSTEAVLPWSSRNHHRWEERQLVWTRQGQLSGKDGEVRLQRKDHAGAADLGDIIDKQCGFAVRKEQRQSPKARERHAIHLFSQALRGRSPSADF